MTDTIHVIKDGAIQVHSGKYISLLEPNMAEVDVHDISMSLANTGRFGGHARVLYSVAQHCVLGSYQAANEKDARDFMFHDASEAYLVDMPTPLKRNLPDYQVIEKKWEAALSIHFNVEYPFTMAVKYLDLKALATERRDMLHMDGEWDILEGIDPWDAKITAWHPLYANYRFLKRLKELGDDVTVPSGILPTIMQVCQHVVYKLLS